MGAGLCALFIIFPILFVIKAYPLLKDAFAKFLKLPRSKQALTIIAICIMTAYAGTKPPTSRVTFENGLKNDGSYVTNDTVHIEWVKTGIPVIPDSADVYIDYRPIAERASDADLANTNDVWQLLGKTTVGAYEFNATLANATNYDYNVWYYYVPSENVHTNGVWAYRTMPARKQVPDIIKAVPLRATTKGDGRTIATPAAKRKEDNQ